MSTNHPALVQEKLAYLEAETDKRMSGVRTNAILIAVFLGGLGLSSIYLRPGKRGMTAAIMAVLVIIVIPTIGVLTLGVGAIIGYSVLWLVELIEACMQPTIYRAHVRNEVEADMVRRQTLYS